MNSKQDRTLLLIEDSRLQYAALQSELRDSGWHIIHAIDQYSALQAYDQGEETSNHIGLVALDLGLPPDRDNPLHVGIPLAKALRDRDADLPILAYTSIPPTATSYTILVAELLPLRVSFIYLRQMSGPGLPQLLEMVWQDYFLLSPGPSDHLPHACPTRPDPLNDRLWETLALVAQGKTFPEIANMLPNVGLEGVRARINSIKEELSKQGELADYQRNRDDLTRWFRENYVRYHRHHLYPRRR